jgi:hypothetical protein
MSSNFYRYQFPKDPDETLDYQFDWTAFIGTDAIASQSTVVVGASLVTSAIDGTNKKVNFRISGGVIDTPASIENTVTTTSGQIAQRTAVIKIKSR